MKVASIISLRRLPLLAFLILLLSSSVGCQGQVHDEHDESSSSDEDSSDEDDDNGYDSMEFMEMWLHFDCPQTMAQPRPVHSKQDWMILREAYHSVVGLNRSSLNDEMKRGFAVPVQVRQAGNKGRGVFVTDQVVPKGQLVWSTHQTARFEKGSDYRIFLTKIPPNLTCDVLQCSYVESLSESRSQTDQAFISVDLDAGCFVNTVSHGFNETPNLGCDPEAAKVHKRGCEGNDFALRDIQVDEELVFDYGDFAIVDGWDWFGL